MHQVVHGTFEAIDLNQSQYYNRWNEEAKIQHSSKQRIKEKINTPKLLSSKKLFLVIVQRKTSIPQPFQYAVQPPALGGLVVLPVLYVRAPGEGPRGRSLFFLSYVPKSKYHVSRNLPVRFCSNFACGQSSSSFLVQIFSRTLAKICVRSYG